MKDLAQWWTIEEVMSNSTLKKAGNDNYDAKLSSKTAEKVEFQEQYP